MLTTLYRSDFKTNPDDGSSFFDDVLIALNIPADDDIEEITLFVDSAKTGFRNGDTQTHG